MITKRHDVTIVLFLFFNHDVFSINISSNKKNIVAIFYFLNKLLYEFYGSLKMKKSKIFLLSICAFLIIYSSEQNPDKKIVYKEIKRPLTPFIQNTIQATMFGSQIAILYSAPKFFYGLFHLFTDQVTKRRKYPKGPYHIATSALLLFGGDNIFNGLLFKYFEPVYDHDSNDLESIGYRFKD